jgi:serine protease
VKLDKNKDVKALEKSLADKKHIKSLAKIKKQIGIVVAGEGFNKDGHFTNVVPAYRKGNLPFYLTGEILLQPKKSIGISQILDLINNQATIVEQTKYNTFVLEAKDWGQLFNISNRIYESGMVEYCHPNFITPRKRYQVNDPNYPDQYYLNNTGQFSGTAGIDINAPEAWNINIGCSVTVAVIDDGVEAHEDLGGRVLTGFTPQFSDTNPDTNGAPNSNNPTPTAYPLDSDGPFGHGQCCAGIIGATHNSLGIRGVAPEVDIVPVNIFTDWCLDSIYDYSTYSWIHFINFAEDANDVANAIDYAWDDAGADVLSNSWGGDVAESAITSAIGRARTQGRNGNGSIVVFASGNDITDNDVKFPANVSGVITVGAIDNNGNIWNYSCRGAEMDLVAPSGDINLSGDVRTIDREGNDGYETGNYTDRFGGTSAACPQVSGVAALMLSVDPDLTEAQVRTILHQTATDMGSAGFDNTYGYGRVNAEAALIEVINQMNLSISGHTIVCNSNVYSVNNLSDDTVTWSISPNYSVFNLTPNIPSANDVLIQNQGWYSATTTLRASIDNGCGEPIVVTKTIVNDNGNSNIQYGSYNQQACSAYNNSFPSQSGTLDGNAIFYHENFKS